MSLSAKRRREFASSISYSDLSEGLDYGRLGQHLASLVLAVAGVAAVALGLAWRQMFPESAYWDRAQADEYVAASLAMKAAADSDARRPGQPDPPELVAARERWEKIQNALSSAQAARTRTPILVAVTGVILAGAGAANYFQGQAGRKRRHL